MHLLAHVVSGLCFGPTPAEEAIRRCEQLLQQATGHPVFETAICSLLAPMYAMSGRFAHARELTARAHSHAEEFGLPFMHGLAAEGGFFVEMLGDAPEAAEGWMRPGYDQLEQIGEKGWRSTYAGYLAQAIYAQGRHAEADRFSEICEDLASSEDIESQVLWRQTRAKLIARRGQFEDAAGLGHEALSLAEKTDQLNLRADVHLDLAEILRLAGRHEQERSAVEDAISFYEAKGNVVSAATARTLLVSTDSSAEASVPPARQ